MSASSSSAPCRRFAATLVVVIVAMLLAGSSAAEAKKRHIKFAGLKSATTCIGGPAIRPGRYTLSWDPATDGRSSAQRIVYRIFQAAVPGGENFSKPTYTTPAGATSFTTPLLAAPVYFIVRARDRAGNEDSNTIEREGQNLCE